MLAIFRECRDGAGPTQDAKGDVSWLKWLKNVRFMLIVKGRLSRKRQTGAMLGFHGLRNWTPTSRRQRWMQTVVRTAETALVARIVLDVLIAFIA